MFRHTKQLQFEAKPDRPDALYAMKFQEILGGQFGEMTVMMQYLFQGWNCRMPGKYKDMLMDIGTEEIGHVEMLATMLARLLEGAPAEVQASSVAANPALAAVVGGMNPQQAIVAGGGAIPTNSQGVPWNAGYIVASGNLLADFRSNVSAEAQSRLQTSRLYNMTDDSGVRAMLKFNLARDTYHQQQWLLAIEQLKEDGLADEIEHSNAEEEDAEQSRTFWDLSEGTESAQGRWATGQTIDGQQIIHLPDAQPLGDVPVLPAPTRSCSSPTTAARAPASRAGTAAGATTQGVVHVAEKVQDALT